VLFVPDLACPAPKLTDGWPGCRPQRAAACRFRQERGSDPPWFLVISPHPGLQPALRRPLRRLWPQRRPSGL